MPGTQNASGHTYIQNCTRTMSGLCSLRIEVLPQVFHSGLSLASPCWKLCGHQWGLAGCRVWGLNQLCVKGPKCLYLKMFSLGKFRFSSEGSSACLKKNEPDWHSGAVHWGGKRLRLILLHADIQHSRVFSLAFHSSFSRAPSPKPLRLSFSRQQISPEGVGDT